ncbi:hypothetical protein Dfri01_08770 [Dyadobacter frigoris]|nr:hypothetical protein Dfri01_08770 [Dyadobacter frigoris]
MISSGWSSAINIFFKFGIECLVNAGFDVEFELHLGKFFKFIIEIIYKNTKLTLAFLTLSQITFTSVK